MAHTSILELQMGCGVRRLICVEALEIKIKLKTFVMRILTRPTHGVAGLTTPAVHHRRPLLAQSDEKP